MCWCLEVEILAIRNEIKVFNSELRRLLFDGLMSPEMKTKAKATILKVRTMVNIHQKHAQEKLIMQISLHHRLELLPATLKLVSAIFLFFFRKKAALQKLLKMLFISSKTYFRSWYIQLFAIFPFLSTLSRFKIANESGTIYDAMNYRCNFLNNSKIALYCTFKLGQVIHY